MRNWIIGIVIALAPGLILAQSIPEKKLRLLCEGVRESGYLTDGEKRRENVTIQLSIFLPSGFFDAESLALSAQLAAHKQYTVPRFDVSDDTFYFQKEWNSDGVTLFSKFKIDRYSGRAVEAQSTSSAKHPGRFYTIAGEYQCRQLDIPVF